jgi:hypothetical protein
MSTSMFVVAALVCAVVQVWAPLATAGEAMRASGDTPQIMAFDHEPVLGDHTPMVGHMRDLGPWGHRLSSLILLSGTGEFFDEEHVTGPNMGTLGPGMSATVVDKGLKHHSLSSVRLASPASVSKR